MDDARGPFSLQRPASAPPPSVPCSIAQPVEAPFPSPGSNPAVQRFAPPTLDSSLANANVAHTNYCQSEYAEQDGIRKRWKRPY